MDIITIRMHGAADNSPLEMISAVRLAYLQRVETAAMGLIAALSSPEAGGQPRPPPLGDSEESASV